MKTWLLIGLLVSVTACTTSLKDVKESAPAQSGQFKASLVTLSRCTLNKLDTGNPPLAAYSYRLIDDPVAKTATISATRSVLFSGIIAGMDLTFHQLDDSTVAVYLRAGSPDGGWLSARTWPLVEACAKAGS